MADLPTIALQTPDMTSGHEGPRVSIITVTRNLIEAGRAASMRTAIECVQTQTARQIEHIILDGASTDGTQDFIQETVDLFAKDPKAVPIHFKSEPDQSLYDAMNKAVALSRGEYVLFLNSDDSIAAPTALEKVLAELGSRRPDYVFGETIYVDEDGSRKHSRRLTSKGILQSIPFCHNSTLIRRDAFNALGGHDLQFRIVADYDMVLRMMMEGRPGFEVHVPVSIFHTGGLSSDALSTSLEMIRSWRKNYGPYVDMARYTDEEALHWIRIGQLPLRVTGALLLAFRANRVMRRAATHSMLKTIRRRLQPWRTWDNLAKAEKPVAEAKQ